MRAPVAKLAEVYRNRLGNAVGNVNLGANAVHAHVARVRGYRGATHATQAAEM